MIHPDERGGSRDLARGLSDALTPALGDTAAPDAVGLAREAAQILGLTGLDRLLAALAPLAGGPWPVELRPALERLRRLAGSAVESGGLRPFREADRELAGLADEVAALQWSPAPAGGPDDAARSIATLGVADALEDLPLADDASREVAGKSRLLPAVAAALRAALDWLTGDPGRSIALRAEDSVLEVTCEHVDADALAAATEVLASVGANLGPGFDPAGAWTVRVPLAGARGSYLMLVHGGLPIAVPWHAVLRLRMAGEAESADRGSLGGWPVMDGPLASGPRAGGDVPLALVAFGRKRGWLVADRLVWRLPADIVAPTDRSPADGLVRVVETDEGERYWLAEPEWLLRQVEAPTLVKPEPRPAPEPSPAPPPASPPPPAPSVESLEERPPQAARRRTPAETLETRLPPAAPPVPHLWLLTPEDVERLEAEAEEVEPAEVEPVEAGEAEPAELEEILRIELEDEEPAEPVAGPPAPVPVVSLPVAPAPPPRAPAAATPGRAAPAPAPAAPPTPRTMISALVAEDSITARIFLARLLGRLGFDVGTVDTAAALRTELERKRWSLVCVDIELPDEAGTTFLAGLASRHGAGTPFVALVRDAEDRAAAKRAGFERMLRKPFDARELEHVLGQLGFLPPRSAW